MATLRELMGERAMDVNPHARLDLYMKAFLKLDRLLSDIDFNRKRDELTSKYRIHPEFVINIVVEEENSEPS